MSSVDIDCSVAVEVLRRASSGIVYDALLDVADMDGALAPGLAPVDPATACFGWAYTVKGEACRDQTADDSLIAWTDMLSRPGKGSVLIIEPNDPDDRAFMGELSAEALHLRGVKGAIVDGGVRDVPFIVRLGFPVFARYRTPRDVVAAWRPTEFEVSVTLGGKTIRPRDLLFADEDGIVCVPRDHAWAVLCRAGEMIEAENAVRTGIRNGMDPKSAYLTHRKF